MQDYFNTTTNTTYGVDAFMQSVKVDTDLSMQSAILYGLDQPIDNIIQQGAFSCPTGNCTWPPFESLAVCNSCTDLSSSLQRIVSDGNQVMYLKKDNNLNTLANPQNSGTAFQIPSGLYLDNVNGFRPDLFNVGYHAMMLATLGTTDPSETTSTLELDTLIWSMSMIRTDPNAANISAVWPNFPISAIECALYYCIKSYNITVSSGIIQEVSKRVPGISRVRDSWDVAEGYAGLMNKSNINSIAFDNFVSAIPRSDLALFSPASGNLFNISSAAVNSISYHFQSMFASGPYTLNITETPPVAGRLNGYYMRSTQLEYEPSVMQALFSSTDLNATFTAVAASMSNALRTGADGSFDGVSISVIGEKGELTTYYRIVWPWICLHCFIVIAGAVFLGITICENRRYGRMVPLWKSSSLAIASHGEVVTDVLSGMQTTKEMRNKARVSRVVFSDRTGMVSSSQEHLQIDHLEREYELQETSTLRNRTAVQGRGGM